MLPPARRAHVPPERDTRRGETSAPKDGGGAYGGSANHGSCSEAPTKTVEFEIQTAADVGLERSERNSTLEKVNVSMS